MTKSIREEIKKIVAGNIREDAVGKGGIGCFYIGDLENLFRSWALEVIGEDRVGGEMEIGLGTDLITGKPKEDFTAYHIYEECRFGNHKKVPSWQNSVDENWTVPYNQAKQEIRKKIEEATK